MQFNKNDVDFYTIHKSVMLYHGFYFHWWHNNIYARVIFFYELHIAVA